jgi:A/G-specific adenine glycosylase
MALHIQKNKFTRLLLKWNSEKNMRVMPWKGEKDPYKIWLSEIILQQTRVAQGLAYYTHFVQNFPDIKKLASATDKKVFKMWEGLGYYTRCRNLMATARFISKEKDGIFPGNYEEIKSLKGIGPYTAAAISSFAFNLPHAVVDGNVYRVLSRIFGIKKSTGTIEGKKYFNKLAKELLDKKKPGIYNQAIMDFGAIICKPASPLCTECIFKKICFAFLNNKINELPVKEKKIVKKSRWFIYLVLACDDEIFIRQRTGKDIWHHLYEFLLFEEKKRVSKQSILHLLEKNKIDSNGLEFSDLYKQQLSHQEINTLFIFKKVKQKPLEIEKGIWIKKNKLRQFTFPGMIREYLKINKF